MRRTKRAPTTSTTAEDLAASLGIVVPPMVDVSKYPPWLLRAAKKAIDAAFAQPYWKKVVASTRNDIRQTVEDAVEAGMSVDDVRKEIEASYGAAYTRARAANIARTETCNAMCAGARAAMDEVEADTGLEIRSEWLSVLGSTTRPEHAEMDGQVADDDGMFEMRVDGNVYRIPWPGHWSLPPEMRCNCQCAIIAAPVANKLN